MRICGVVLVVSVALALLAMLFMVRRAYLWSQTAVEGTISQLQVTKRAARPRDPSYHSYDYQDSAFNHFGLLPSSSVAVRNVSRHTSVASSFPKFTPLTPQEVKGIQQFVLFIGYPGSGHSIIGSVMDAHPQMIISHEFSVLLRLSSDPELRSKVKLFNAIYKDSYNDFVRGWRNAENTKKGYNLGTGSRWQAQFTDLKVIGDKSGGRTTRFYYQDPEEFDLSYSHLLRTAEVPIRVIHVVRNPYDMAATEMLYQLSHEAHGVKYGDVNSTNRYNDTSKLERHIKGVSKRAEINVILMQKYHMNVLEVHNCDFVLEPRATVERICRFLGLGCPERYLHECSAKAFKEVSKSRRLVVWNEDLFAVVQELISKYPFFQNYSFESN